MSVVVLQEMDMVEKSFVEGDVDDIPSDVEVEEQDVNEGQFISSILTHHTAISPWCGISLTSTRTSFL